MDVQLIGDISMGRAVDEVTHDLTQGGAVISEEFRKRISICTNVFKIYKGVALSPSVLIKVPEI